MRRAALACVVLLVLAGCSAGGGSSPTATPAAVPTDRPVPPGLGEESVANASALVDAHDAALSGTSFTVRREYLVRAPNGTVYVRETVTTLVGADGTYRHVEDRDVSPGAVFGEEHVESWSDGNRTLLRYGRDDARVLELSPGHGADRREFLTRPDGGRFRPLLTGDGRRTVERVERDGETRFLVTVRSESPVGVGAPRPRGFVADTPFTYELVVGMDGVVRSMAVRYEGHFLDGGDATLTFTVRYVDVGETTVERPAWAA
ncbi:DUF7537 family lipoprotein [Halomarina litorea]|uniref:DUF7537 family lipoprotein n=1 Tax=Halomarina litorea TaxID=2961595 RepID=UPI0020C4C9BF|nr:hypothetical protein [Halomarina sp. BCD28]